MLTNYLIPFAGLAAESLWTKRVELVWDWKFACKWSHQCCHIGTGAECCWSTSSLKSNSKKVRILVKFQDNLQWPLHTETIWTFTFHKTSGWFWRPISNKPTGQIMNTFICKSITYTHFPFIFSTAFCTLLFQKRWYVWVTFFYQIATKTCKLIG